MKLFVYVFKVIDKPYYKIGYSSSSVSGRLSAANTYSPFGIECKYLIHTKDPLALEKQLHKELALFNVRNEWFKFSERTISSFLEANYKDVVHKPEEINAILADEPLRDYEANPIVRTEIRRKHTRKTRGRRPTKCRLKECEEAPRPRSPYCCDAHKMKDFRRQKAKA